MSPAAPLFLVGQPGSATLHIPSFRSHCELTCVPWLPASPRCREGGAWRQGDKPQFDVQHLAYKLRGNNVPMPSTLVKHLLRIFIPEIIQRRLLPLLPREFGDYMLAGGWRRGGVGGGRRVWGWGWGAPGVRMLSPFGQQPAAPMDSSAVHAPSPL